MSILRIVIIASNARLAAALSGLLLARSTARGVICHEKPQPSLHQPQALSCPPLRTMALQGRAVGSGSSVRTRKLAASLTLGPAVRPTNGGPSAVNASVSSVPA